MKFSLLFVAIAFLHLLPAQAQQVGTLTSFTGGTPIIATEVNNNFLELRNKININDTFAAGLQTQITAAQTLANSANTAATAANATAANASSGAASANASIAAISLFQPRVYTVGGSPYTVTVPAGAVAVTIEAVGGGGGGSTGYTGGSVVGGGGSAGNYAKGTFSVAGVSTLTVTVGNGGAENNSSYSTCSANPPTGSAGQNSSVEIPGSPAEPMIIALGGTPGSSTSLSSTCQAPGMSGQPPTPQDNARGYFNMQMSSGCYYDAYTPLACLPTKLHGAGGRGASFEPGHTTALPGNPGLVTLTFHAAQ